jgi:16S rRNA (cytidine1402-2'-O)-methyltransferase
MIHVMGDRQAVVARELTKLHEEILRGPLSRIVKEISVRTQLKGECTLLVEGRERKKEADRQSVRNYLIRLRREKDSPLSDLVKQIAKEYDLPKKLVYEEALRLEKEG